MATKLTPPQDADVRRVSIGARVYEPKSGVWTIDDNHADDLRRLGWQDVPAPKLSVTAVTSEGANANPDNN